MESKRCLLVIDDLGMGGAQRQLINLGLSLSNRGYFIEILYYYNRNVFSEILSNSNIPAFLIEEKNPLKRIIAFRSFIRGGKYDIIISYLGIPGLLCELASFPCKKWKLIVSERSSNPIIRTSLKSRFIRFFHLFADYVVCNSKSNQELIREVNPLLTSKKLRHIYNMIDLSVWVPETSHTYRSNGKLNLTIIANYRQLKNLRGLLESLLLLSAAEREQLSVKWFGNGLLEPHLDETIIADKQFITKNNLEKTISLNQATTRVRQEMEYADVIGLFSHFEGLPNSICEGMALGKPIISSAVSDVPDLVKDGINGKLCRPDDPNTIAEALKFFIEADIHLLEEMGHRNRERALDLFDGNKITNQYIGLF